MMNEITIHDSMSGVPCNLIYDHIKDIEWSPGVLPLLNVSMRVNFKNGESLTFNVNAATEARVRDFMLRNGAIYTMRPSVIAHTSRRAAHEFVDTKAQAMERVGEIQGYTIPRFADERSGLERRIGTRDWHEPERRAATEPRAPMSREEEITRQAARAIDRDVTGYRWVSHMKALVRVDESVAPPDVTDTFGPLTNPADAYTVESAMRINVRWEVLDGHMCIHISSSKQPELGHITTAPLNDVAAQVKARMHAVTQFAALILIAEDGGTDGDR